MSISKFKRFAAFAAALTMLLTSLTACGAKQEENISQTSGTNSENDSDAAKSTKESKTSSDSGYESKLFDTSYVHTVDITISDEDLADLNENPLDKTKYNVDISIDGETLGSVSLATKGNTSLSFVAGNDDSDRYSFKINFGKYTDGQTYYGLDKLNLNNLYADATFMKDHLSYEIFRQAGVDSPLTSYVWLTINGEDGGLYLAVEDIGESYLERTNNGEGELYKPETEMLDNMDKMGGGKGKPGGGDFTPPEGFDFENMTPPDGMDFGNMTPPEGMEMPDMKDGERPEFPEGMDFGDMPPPNGGNLPEKSEKDEKSDSSDSDKKSERGDMPGGFGGFGGFGGSSNGADLAYTDDKIESYSDIFDNDETKADDDDKQRVITALKGLSEGKDLEKYLDTDEIIRYFAAHNFVLNYDSYTGNMLHNYYLYENDGKLSMLPWDYNLAFGNFAGGPGSKGGESGESVSSTTALVNKGIDTPLSGAEESSRPMWAWITSNEEYLNKYHEVYDELLKNYFESGKFEKQIDSLYEMLLPYIEKDSGAFYSKDEFEKAYNTLKKFCLLRADSIRAQLDGTLSTDSDKQKVAAMIAADDINTDDMGSQVGGDKGGT